MVLVVCLISISQISYSQHNIVGNADIKFIKSISNFREKLLIKYKDDISFFDKTYAKWLSLEKNEEKLDDVINALYRLVYHTTASQQDILTNLKTIFPNSELVNVINFDEILSIIDHYPLIQLIRHEIVKPQYPYTLIENDLFKDFRFFSLKNDFKIAEIGAGNGSYSFFLGMLDLHLTIFVNEIDNNLLLNATTFMDTTIIGSNSYQYVLGNNETINIQDTLDVVLIRNSFHHFDKKKAMLKSIHSQLRDNGFLFIEEAHYSKENKKEICPKIMKEEDILKILRKSNFAYLDHLKKEHTTIYKFKKILKNESD